MKFALATTTATLMAGTAMAGGYTPPVVEPTPVIAAAPIVVDNDWTGFYAGAQLGFGSAELKDETTTPPASYDEDLTSYGLHVGYNHDFGQFVLGGELDFNKIDVDNVDDKADLTRLRLRAGYDMGRFMPYVTLGAAKISADGISETDPTYGIGADFMATDRIVIGGEYTYQKWKDVDGVDGVDLDASMFQLRASYRF